MSLEEIVSFLNGIAWGPWMLVLLVGTGVFISVRLGFIQFRKFGYAMKNTLGKIFTKQEAGEGEITPFQSVTTALAATVVPATLPVLPALSPLVDPVLYFGCGFLRCSAC